MKIYLFRDQFRLTARELNAIRDICQFIIRLYVKVWFTAPLAAVAPNHDLTLLIDLHSYASIDKEISRVTLKKIIFSFVVSLLRSCWPLFFRRTNSS